MRYATREVSAVIIWLPRWHCGKESACQCRRRKFDPWIGQIPWSRKWQPNPVFLPGKSHGNRSLVGYSPCGHRVGYASQSTPQPQPWCHWITCDPSRRQRPRPSVLRFCPVSSSRYSLSPNGPRGGHHGQTLPLRGAAQPHR